MSERSMSNFPEATLAQRILAFLMPSDGLSTWFPANLGLSTGLAFVATMPQAWVVLGICIGLDLLVGGYAAWKRHRFTLRKLGDGILRKMILVALVGAVYAVSATMQLSDFIGTLFTLCLAGIDFVSVIRNCKHARINLPPGFVRLALWVEHMLNGELDRKVEGLTKALSSTEDDARWRELHRQVGGNKDKSKE